MYRKLNVKQLRRWAKTVGLGVIGSVVALACLSSVDGRTISFSRPTEVAKADGPTRPVQTISRGAAVDEAAAISSSFTDLKPEEPEGASSVEASAETY